jgi:hypothetical protein
MSQHWPAKELVSRHTHTMNPHSCPFSRPQNVQNFSHGASKFTCSVTTKGAKQSFFFSSGILFSVGDFYIVKRPTLLSMRLLSNDERLFLSNRWRVGALISCTDRERCTSCGRT